VKRRAPTPPWQSKLPLGWTAIHRFHILSGVESILDTALGQDSSQAAAAEKRDLLQRLLGRLAHEIRNPLSSLDVHVQLLEEDLAGAAPELRGQLNPRLEIIHGELHRLKSIVENFLRLTGPSALDREPVQLDKIATHVCELLRPEAASRQIDIRCELATDLPVISADPVRLTQALLNLVINALQALGRAGHITVSVLGSPDQVRIQVRDTGPGIPPEKMIAIFDPYFTTKPEGTGLGLWIAQQIVASHGGTLRAENSSEGGAVFVMSLPRQAAREMG
jgi:signal transduction histidine kinase